jgi:hypothetical protein
MKSLVRKYLLLACMPVAVLLCIYIILFVRKITLGPGTDDYCYDIVGGYQLERSSSNMEMIIPKGVFSSNDPQIPPRVVKIAWNDQYIIAQQQNLSTISSRNVTRNIPDASMIYYWILDTKIPKVYGPYSINEFQIMIHELGITKPLIMKNVEYYRDHTNSISETLNSSQ